jgi:hypothetical protein
MPVLGLHVLIAIFFAVHAIRTGQDKYWLFVLFAFPILGSVVYGIAIWLPAMRHSRQGRQVVSGVQRLLDPSKELRAAQEALDVSATPNARLRLADALLNAGRASEAVAQYHEVLTGIYAKDPQIRVHLAAALLDAGKAADARAELERLIAEQPNFKSPEGHLIFARAVAATGDRPKAREEFETPGRLLRRTRSSRPLRRSAVAVGRSCPLPPADGRKHEDRPTHARRGARDQSRLAGDVEEGAGSAGLTVTT